MDSDRILGNIKHWEISNYELAYAIVPPYQGSNGTLKLYIPKIMPAVAMGAPKSTSVTLSSSCFCNDSKCKPSVPGSVSTQNYLTVPPQANRSFELPVLWYGSRVFVEVRHKNPDNLFVTTKEDNSALP